MPPEVRTRRRLRVAPHEQLATQTAPAFLSRGVSERHAWLPKTDGKHGGQLAALFAAPHFGVRHGTDVADRSEPEPERTRAKRVRDVGEAVLS
ncbi:hypothetical protein P8C59_000700 [Phyllachora maydis]|uniref:Uncharacterized protein n=1 Tax=Phyllachora maydis TaxID=1825666 RepID=A0AAD9HY75_9PEZI|nr:hypothetical protein P8C59_000700 [Phyllachora maydis]